MNNRFHACATCVNFCSVRDERGVQYYCSRLGYETKPDYKFNCWEPKEHVKNLMEKEKWRGEHDKSRKT
ncbi:hypothetical protein D1970_13815 [Mesobacillus zeae]|uniref:Uncharacterized protein n=1 Tax=Mesobacillus zeae TaxID=1917180 RepID=A0A398B2N5_9BACI|nr:hypothetical protein D1970_13815 [Mesobacillus zeae]